jgi:hypothetical protein
MCLCWGGVCGWEWEGFVRVAACWGCERPWSCASRALRIDIRSQELTEKEIRSGKQQQLGLQNDFDVDLRASIVAQRQQLQSTIEGLSCMLVVRGAQCCALFCLHKVNN